MINREEYLNADVTSSQQQQKKAFNSSNLPRERSSVDKLVISNIKPKTVATNPPVMTVCEFELGVHPDRQSVAKAGCM